MFSILGGLPSFYSSGSLCYFPNCFFCPLFSTFFHLAYSLKTVPSDADWIKTYSAIQHPSVAPYFFTNYMEILFSDMQGHSLYDFHPVPWTV